MYEYRKMAPERQDEILRYRRLRGCPLHEPPHLHQTEGWFLITAATCDHKAHFVAEEDRLRRLDELFAEFQAAHVPCSAWVVLPTHYHLLLNCRPLSVIGEPLRRAHARTARELNRRAGMS